MHPTKLLLSPLPVLVAGAFAVTGCGTTNSNANQSSPPPAAAPKTTTTPATGSSSGPITADLSEFKIAPSATTAGAGPVTFDVTNNGKLPHEMVVLKTTKAAAALGKAGTSRLPETGHVGEVATLKPGASGKTTINLKPGHYVLICNLPGHWTAGMREDLTVR
jgi:uncharacterized cupredoxin-like copper-binding protein